MAGEGYYVGRHLVQLASGEIRVDQEKEATSLRNADQEEVKNNTADWRKMGA